MATLMAEMAQEGTVGLVQLMPSLLPLHVVRFRHINRDHPVVVAGKHRSGPGDVRVGEEFIRQAVRRIVAFRGQGESEVQEAVEQAAPSPLPGGTTRPCGPAGAGRGSSG